MTTRKQFFLCFSLPLRGEFKHYLVISQRFDHFVIFLSSPDGKSARMNFCKTVIIHAMTLSFVSLREFEQCAHGADKATIGAHDNRRQENKRHGNDDGRP